jgi:hypothetical protein
MAITIDDVEALKRELEELPRNQPRQVTKQEAVAMLASHLGSAKRRGYSPEELAGILSARGIEINAPTLRGYLRRNRKKRGRISGTPGRTTKPSAATREAAPAAAPAPGVVAPVLPAPSTRIGAVGQESARAATRSTPEAPSGKDGPAAGR